MSAISVHSTNSHFTHQDFERLGTEIETDWYGSKLDKAPKYFFTLSETHLHFWAGQKGLAGSHHPTAQPGQFHAELWRFDVAEFFLTSPNSSHYLEFNLSPNGAWWSCAFEAPRVAASGNPQAIPGVTTESQQTSSSWWAHAAIPRAWLEQHLGLGPDSHLNATFILNSPDQLFATASDLGDGEPNFHRPEKFPRIDSRSLA